MDFEEHTDQEEEMDVQQVPQPQTLKMGPPGEGASAAARRTAGAVRYRECLKNHAVGIGGNAVDGCCEFMAAGAEGTLDGLKCAACNCHRNFHRKEVEGEVFYAPPYHNQYTHPLYRAPPPAGYLHISGPRPLALPAASGGREEEDNPSSSGGGGSGGLKKRFRTKFTQEQKDKMLGFAERLGWRIQKHDEAAVEQFCAENGVKRHVFKVWMHNNKNTLGKKP